MGRSERRSRESPAENSAETIAPPTSGRQHDDDVHMKYVARLLPVIRYRGFSALRIDAIVRAMDISKATFYKHFTSKEDVIARIVEVVVTYLQETTTLIDDHDSPFEVRFQRIFEQSVLIATYLSEIFVRDLQQTLPHGAEQIRSAQRERQRHLAAFYTEGMAAGVFQPLPQALALLQDDVLLPRLLEPRFLLEHDLTLRAALEAYYDLQKYQWCVAAVRERLDDTSVHAYIALMATKIAHSLGADMLR